MRKNILYIGMAVAFIAFSLLDGCRKDTGFYKSEANVRSFPGSIYDFLKSQTGVYDSFLYVLDRVDLADYLKGDSGEYTVFAPTNASFERAIADVNRLRKTQRRPLVYLSTVPLEQLDSLACRYIIKGAVPADSMNSQDGIFFNAIRYDYMMHGKLNITNAEGFVEGGPQVIDFADTKGVIYTRQWSVAKTVAIDIKTNNGLVNVLDRNHLFGFDEFITRVNPTYSVPYFGEPLPIPGTIGFEYYDKGGERVGYHDDEAHNYGTHGYRTNEGVDIGVGHSGDRGYLVGWTNPGEWLNYTVDIADTGYYKVLIRAASPENDASLHFLWDGRKINDKNIEIQGTGDADTYANNEAVIGPLKKGKHVLTVWLDYAGYDLRWMQFIPYNKPFPVPGTIPAVEYNKGGEGVGYHDSDNGNNGGQYRKDEGVDIEQSAQLEGYSVGWTNGGEWLKYDIEVKQTGDYVVAVKVATSRDPEGGTRNRFHVEFDGANLTGTMFCPNTGDYQKWTNVTAIVHLEKGDHVMRFYEETDGYNFRSITISAVH